MYAIEGAGNANLTVRMAQEMTFNANQPKRATDEKFYRMVKGRIELAARKGLFTVDVGIPKFEIGTPCYDATAVRNRLVKKLQGEGFSAVQSGESGLHIEWRRNSGNRKVRFADT